MPRLPNSVRLVPKDASPLDEWLALVERLGWEKSEEFSEDNLEWKAGEDTVVRWVDDGGVQFFVVEGPGHERVAEQIKESIDMLEVEDFEGYLKRFRGTQGLMQGLDTVAAAAPADCDPRVLELFERYMSHEDPLIRRVALLATAITGWPEFVEPVSKFSDDPDPDVRKAAEAALRGLKSSQ
jgi:hypothetical protein